VTGANYLLETSNGKIMIDCGMFQGSHYFEKQNFEKFPYKPEEISAVFVTHPHVDHIGRLPQLQKAGFQGRVFSTPPAKDAAELLLLDAEHILREEAIDRGHKPPYEVGDVTRLMGFWQKISYHEKVKVGDFEVELYNSGHVLGAASILVKAEGKTIAFSGDLGNMPTPFIRPTEYIPRADYALIESAYGSRVHEKSPNRKDLLEDFVEEIVGSGGVLMIPAFALERTQSLIFELNELVENKRIPRAPVYIDSPLAIKLTAVYQKYSDNPLYFRPEAIEQMRQGDGFFNFPGLHMTLTTEQSKEINNVPPPKIIIAGSGMSNAGRILHHEVRYIPDPKSALLIVGFQGQGSLGRQILDGAKTVKILGQTVPVRCKIRSFGGYSAHADQPQLLKWVEMMRGSLRKIFVVQGEPTESLSLAQRIRDDLAVEAEIPKVGESVVL